MEPTKKDEQIETFLKKMGADRVDAITFDRCLSQPMECGGPAVEFTDALSLKEYTISGVCQECQD